MTLYATFPPAAFSYVPGISAGAAREILRLCIRPGLTPLAAAGLLIIMIGATGLTLAAGTVICVCEKEDDHSNWHHED